MRLVEVKTDKDVKAFISLSHQLYLPKYNMQKDDEVKKLLNKQHILSKYFLLKAFLLYDEKTLLGRFALTSYPKDDTLYLGFYECSDNEFAAKTLFDFAKIYAKERAYKKIVGPVDASFWIKYRLKINAFKERPYTGEPYNLPYYLKQFQNNGFKIAENYTSSSFNQVDKDYTHDKLDKRYDMFKDKGYVIKSPRPENWKQTVKEVYRLIRKLYANFPVYKEISLDDFQIYFDSYEKILDNKMVKIPYYQGKALGFFISLPDYHNLVYHTNNPLNILKIMAIKKKPQRYILIYIGVDYEHRGLGSAMAKVIIDELKASGAKSIGALQRDGNMSKFYGKDMVAHTYKYVLMDYLLP